MLTDKFYAIAEAGHEVTLILLILLSIFSLAFIFERYLVLRAAKRSSQKMQNRVRESLQSYSLKDIEDWSKDKETLEGRALAYGIRHIQASGAAGLEEIFNSYSLIERPKLERYLSFLATVGSNAPFIGLLGTVFGVMDAFRGLAVSQGDASAVMLGISKALVATAVGLMVAIPAVIAYNFFQRQVKSVMQGLESVKALCLAYAKARGK